jgi:hypothetical protein
MENAFTNFTVYQISYCFSPLGSITGELLWTHCLKANLGKFIFEKKSVNIALS